MTRFKVQARDGDPFPADMLRYDRCWPADIADANRIENSILHQGDIKQRPIELESAKDPTPARWDSFGWSVLA